MFPDGRGRRRSAVLVVAFVLVAFARAASSSSYSSSAAAAVGDVDDVDNHPDEYDHDNEYYEDDNEDIRRLRRLRVSASEAFDNLTPHKVRMAIPLDLKIDRISGEAYASGAGGYLTSYASAFDASSSSSSPSSTSGGGGGGKRSYWDGMIHLDDVIVGRRRERDDVDATDGLYYELRNGLLRGSSPSSSSSSSSGGKGEAAAENDRDDRVLLLSSEEEEEDRASKNTTTGKTTTTMVVGDDNNAMVEAKSIRNNRMTKKRTKEGGANDKLPRIGQTFPSRGSEIRKNAQTFGARVLPSKVTGSEVRAVYFQLTDDNGDMSDLLELEKVSDDVYEITIDGFDEYAGTSWTYGIVAEDDRGKRRYSDGISFDIVTSGDLGGRKKGDGDDDEVNEEEDEPSPDVSGSSSGAPMPKKYETDSDWSHGGTVQSATGRILFEFDGSDETYVCTGTVVHDGPYGDTPDNHNGRSIVQTAAHCAYSDVLGKFAKRAVFVPDQDSTVGRESDYDCDNDRYGCWHLSYAIVAEGWTTSNFPENVPYDYAYYVAYDDPAAHAGGYDDGLTGVLDADVRSMRIDFDAIIDDGEFVFSVGYSADRDPSLRHCAMERTTINGVEWYENYWLDNCAMTGGASGGPWLVDVDDDGVGTLISVNSWGFAHKIGMAGPSLRTSSGSLAECLYNKAKDSKDPGSEGGYIVSSC